MSEEKNVEETTNEIPMKVEEPVATPVKKKKNIWLILGLSGLGIFVLIGVILGYGFYNGYQIRSYAVFAEKTYSVTKDWDKAFNEKNPEKIKEEITRIKSEADTALSEVNSKAAPAKAQKLKDNMKEYFTLSKSTIAEIEGLIDWSVEIEKVGTDITSLSTVDTSSPEAMIVSVQKSKDGIDAAVVRIEKLDVPSNLKAQNESFVKMLKSLSATYGKLITALQNNDANALTNISSEFTATGSELNTMEDPSKAITTATEQSAKKIDELEKTINTEIITLKNVGFSY